MILTEDLLLDTVDAKPSFVAAEFVLLGCREVTFASVGKRDAKRPPKRTPLLQIEADFGEDLVRDCRDAQLADANGLELHINGIRPFIQCNRAGGVGFGRHQANCPDVERVVRAAGRPEAEAADEANGPNGRTDVNGGSANSELRPRIHRARGGENDD